MALNFQGDRAVGVLNDPKNTFNTDDLFRVYDGGILVAGGVSVDHGDFVSWDGTKWVHEVDIRMAVTPDDAVGSVAQQSSNIADAFSASSTYAIGEVVIGPDGKLYQCTTAVETAGEWDPEDWDETSLGDILFTSRGSSNIEVRKSHCKVGDAVYADGDGNVHFIAGKSVTSASIPEGWEFTGVVALREGTSAKILHKSMNTIKFASAWLFKVNGLKLDGTDTMVMQQAKPVGGYIEVGTFTASESATDLDTLVSELNTWLLNNPTAEGAIANYNWHAQKLKEKDGNDACFIIVDNTTDRTVSNPIKSSSSGASAEFYFWQFVGFTEDIQTCKRKDGVDTYAVVWNKERFKANNVNINNPTDSLTTAGLFNEASFNATSVVKEHYGTYDNYLDNMMADENAVEGVIGIYRNKGKQLTEGLSPVKYTPIGGDESAVYPAANFASRLKAHSTASVDGLNAGDWYMPSINEQYGLMKVLKIDGSDPINSTMVRAGGSAINLANGTWSTARWNYMGVWRYENTGALYAFSLYAIFRTIAIASYDVGE